MLASSDGLVVFERGKDRGAPLAGCFFNPLSSFGPLSLSVLRAVLEDVGGGASSISISEVSLVSLSFAEPFAVEEMGDERGNG